MSSWFIGYAFRFATARFSLGFITKSFSGGWFSDSGTLVTRNGCVCWTEEGIVEGRREGELLVYIYLGSIAIMDGILMSLLVLFRY